MRILALALPLIALTGATACTVAPDAHSSRSATATLAFTQQGAELGAQAKALQDISRRVVAQTTLKGAGVGAAMGCGMVLVSAGNTQNCLSGAAAGAVGGALIGRAVGKRKVAREIAAISPSAVVRTLRQSSEQMALVQRSLPARLAAQEAALSQLDLQRATGAIDAATYVSSRAAIASERQSIAVALLQTQTNAARAANNLRAAKEKGQTGLDWHIGAASKLSQEAGSARSNISLL